MSACLTRSSRRKTDCGSGSSASGPPPKWSSSYIATVAGFALFFHNFSTFLGRPGLYLEDLFVKPEWRGRGIGQRLLVHLAGLAVERGCGRMEWTVLDWNEPALRFYERMGARDADGSSVGSPARVSLASRQEIMMLAANRKTIATADAGEQLDDLYRSFDHVTSATDPGTSSDDLSPADRRSSASAPRRSRLAVASVLQSIESLLAVMGQHPAQFVRGFDPARSDRGSSRWFIDGFLDAI